MSSAPPGWYGDPFGRDELRYWDGLRWTAHVSSDGTFAVEGSPDVSRRGRKPSLQWTAVAVVATLGLAMLSVGLLRTFQSSDSFSSALNASARQRTLSVQLTEEAGPVSARLSMQIDRGRFASVRKSLGRDIAEYHDSERDVVKQDDAWREVVVRTSRLNESSPAWELLRHAQVTQIRRAGHVTTFSADCTGDPTLGKSQWPCDPAAEPTIEVDVSRGRIVEVRMSGRIPTYPGERHSGTITITFDYASRVEVRPPTDVDRSGVDCIADQLGMSSSDLPALRRAIDDYTTEQLRSLYTESCDFDWWPSGKDLNR